MIKKIAKKQNKNTDDEIVTRGILRHELKIEVKKQMKNELDKFEKRFEAKLDKKMEEKFVTKNEFRNHEDAMARMFGLVMDELGYIRTDIREMRLEINNLFHVTSRHDHEIGDLQERVMRIEKK